MCLPEAGGESDEVVADSPGEALVAEREKIGKDAAVMSDNEVAQRMIDRAATRAE